MRGTGYWSAHRRVRAERGPAGEQRCAVCGGPAAVWCYDGEDDLAERADARGRRYSADPARYRPCCRFCARRAVLDRNAAIPPGCGRPLLDVERAERLYRAGATSRGVAALMGVSRGVVLRALRARGVPIRPPVAPQRHPRRYSVTPRPQPQPGAQRDHQQPDDEPSAPIFSATPASTTPYPCTTPISTASSTEQEQLPGQQMEPQSQSGPTHHDPTVGAASPGGPAAPGSHDPHDDRSEGE